MKASRLRKKVTLASLAGVVYKIWENRNLTVWEGKCLTPAVLSHQCTSEHRHRIRSILPGKIDSVDGRWLGEIEVL